MSGGDYVAGKPSNDDASMDRLSTLPNSVLLHVLAGLGDAAAAGRTSVLSGRWRHLWALLPELRFVPRSPKPGLIASALAAHEADLRNLDVTTQDAARETVAAWLRVAARRLAGSLVFTNQDVPRNGRDSDDDDGEGRRSVYDERPRRRGVARDDDDAKQGRGAFELPCLDRATSVSLDLGHLGLTMPRAGAFARLTEFSLINAQLPGGGPCALGDAVSSRRCPCLQRLTIMDVPGVEDLTVRSDSLRHMELTRVRDLRQLAIVAPALEHLQVLLCFYRHWPRRRPVASITARQLKVLKWGDPFDRRSVQLGKKHLEAVCPDLFLVYGIWPNNGCLELLRCFNNIETLSLTLVHPPDINNKPCLLKNMKMLPGVTFLNLSVISNGHAFGASLFHVLRLCSSTRKLTLHISGKGLELEKQTACPPGCICDEQQDWKFEELLLNHLQEVEITELRGYEHEVIFLKHLLGWATELKKMTIFFNSLVTESMARKSYQILRRFSRLEISMDFYMEKSTMTVSYVPKD
ncbi:hypothetical protein SORBI_3002G014900 [Sorghum bicolor]|uniref:FBD domain-containing protein n=2 Tax=Sorghum bicolor TaxID=4558 RepID=A0A1W0W1T0_SORBI|nr:hypothetical protein SORBI_3002G014900 [Sorghum bicolor]